MSPQPTGMYNGKTKRWWQKSSKDGVWDSYPLNCHHHTTQLHNTRSFFSSPRGSWVSERNYIQKYSQNYIKNEKITKPKNVGTAQFK